MVGSASRSTFSTAWGIAPPVLVMYRRCGKLVLQYASVCQQRPDCRYACQSRDTFRQQSIDDLFSKHELDQYNGSALLKRGHQLIHAGIETKRQNGENAVPVG